MAFLSERFNDAIPHILRVYYEYLISYIILGMINNVKKTHFIHRVLFKFS